MITWTVKAASGACDGVAVDLTALEGDWADVSSLGGSFLFLLAIFLVFLYGGKVWMVWDEQVGAGGGFFFSLVIDSKVDALIPGDMLGALLPYCLDPPLFCRCLIA